MASQQAEPLPPAPANMSGHGFGLAIVTGLARQDGYRLKIFGERGSGTSNGLTVPV